MATTSPASLSASVVTFPCDNVTGLGRISEVSKKPRNPKQGAGLTSKGDVMYTPDGKGNLVMRKGKTQRDRAKERDGRR